MSIFGRLRRDDPEPGPRRHRSGRCLTAGCGRWIAAGDYCAACTLDRMRAILRQPDEETAEHALDDWPTRAMTEVELAAITAPLPEPTLPNLYGLSPEEAARVAQEAWLAELELTAEQSAPLFAREWYDLRCVVCCHIIAEHTTARVRPTTLGCVCLRHAQRRRAHGEVCDHITRWLETGVQSAEVADYFHNGYLGDRLHDDEPL